MQTFIPHRQLIEIMWYGGMSIEQIDAALVDSRYNPLPERAYEDIIAGVRNSKWIEAHEANKVIYAHNNMDNYNVDMEQAFYREEDFSHYYNPGTLHDIMTYMVRSKRIYLGIGTTKTMKIFTTEKLRQFVEMCTLVGMSTEAMRQYLAILIPSYGVWSVRPIITYLKVFWDASRQGQREKGITNRDIREYLNIDTGNEMYGHYHQFLDGCEEDVLSYFGLADYTSVIRKNRSLHGKISGQIMDYFDDKSRKIIPSDYVKLYVHLDSQMQEQEAADKGMEAYREEIKRIFDRIEYVKDSYKTMDDLNNLYIATTDGIEVDEPYVKDEKE